MRRHSLRPLYSKVTELSFEIEANADLLWGTRHGKGEEEEEKKIAWAGKGGDVRLTYYVSGT